MAEWSKAADLSSVIYGCVGSNPTECKSVLFNAPLAQSGSAWVLCTQGRGFKSLMEHIKYTMDSMAEWLRR